MKHIISKIFKWQIYKNYLRITSTVLPSRLEQIEEVLLEAVQPTVATLKQNYTITSQNLLNLFITIHNQVQGEREGEREEERAREKKRMRENEIDRDDAQMKIT